MKNIDKVEQRLESDGKEHYIRALFNSAAPKYDLTSTVISMGMFPRWHRAAIRKARLRPGDMVLDVACGTGGLTLLLAQEVGPEGKVTGVDLSEGMLEVARKKANTSPYRDRVTLLSGNAMDLPFEDGTFDSVTMAFALRNVVDPVRTLREMVRVTRQGGRVLNMDIAIPTNPVMHALYYFHMTKVMTALDWIADRLQPGRKGNHRYQYLHKSQKFAPDRIGMVSLIKSLGCQNVSVQDLFGGCVVIYTAQKA